MINKINVIEITQPIGTFYVGKIASKDLLKVTTVNRRMDVSDGIQRDLSKIRVKEIAAYCEDPDATFPTPIILSVNTSESEKITVDECNNFHFEFDGEKRFAEILDGQHRVDGIRENPKADFELLVVIMFDLTQEEKAYIFSTINSNQAKVDKSLIYDLFELNETRSPYKTCHDLARILNSNPQSPFFNRLKMLGKKTSENESLSQGTFVTYLLPLISRNPKDDTIKLKKGWQLKEDSYIPFRNMFIEDRDELILKVLINYFDAVKSVFRDEWNNPNNYILSKTTGFGALIKALKTFYDYGIQQKTLTYEFFKDQLSQSKKTLLELNLELTSKDFPSNEHQQTELSRIFTKHIIDK